MNDILWKKTACDIPTYVKTEGILAALSLSIRWLGVQEVGIHWKLFAVTAMADNFTTKNDRDVGRLTVFYRTNTIFIIFITSLIQCNRGVWPPINCLTSETEAHHVISWQNYFDRNQRLMKSLWKRYRTVLSHHRSLLLWCYSDWQILSRIPAPFAVS